MPRLKFKLLAATLFGIGALALSGTAQDSPAEVPLKQDWSAYVTFREIAGEVVSFEDPTLTLKVTTYSVTGGGGGGGNRRPGQRGGGGARPQQVKANSQEIDLTFADQGLVRWYKLAPKVGLDGRKQMPNFKEIQKLKLPQGAPGYIASKSDLVPGQIVAVTLVRPRDIPLTKLQESDLAIKYVVIAGVNPAAGAEGLGAGFEKKKE